MNILLNNNVLVGMIRNYYAKQGLDVSVFLTPVVVEKHYDVVCDTIVEVRANGERKIINDGLQIILDSEMQEKGLRVLKASCNTEFRDGKPHLCGVNAFVNNETHKVLERSL